MSFQNEVRVEAMRINLQRWPRNVLKAVFAVATFVTVLFTVHCKQSQSGIVAANHALTVAFYDVIMMKRKNTCTVEQKKKDAVG